MEVQPYKQAGFAYAALENEVPARVTLNVMQSGFAFRLRMKPEFTGPCARCLEEATLTLRIDSYEVHDPSDGDEDLVSDFVAADDLHVADWAQDAIGLEFPHRVLCAEDCRGLCATCGTNLNEVECACVPEQGDSRWDALRALQIEEPSEN